MDRADLLIRPARAEDAAVLAAAARAIARTPGRLASRPEEIHDEQLGGTTGKTNTLSCLSRTQPQPVHWSNK